MYAIRSYYDVKAEDVQATLLELTVCSIADAVRPAAAQEVILCGGGAKNPLLCARLAALLPSSRVLRSDALGVDSDFMEAMAFAWLAYERINGRRITSYNVCYTKLLRVHQDIRPENIIIDDTEIVKIIDFGSTRVNGIVDINTT